MLSNLTGAKGFVYCTFHNFQLNGQKTVVINSEKERETPDKRLKQISKKTGSNCGRKLMNVWVLPNGSISFRKPKYVEDSNKSNLMLRNRASSSSRRSVNDWSSSSRTSRRKKTGPTRLDRILAQVNDRIVPNDESVVDYFERKSPTGNVRSSVVLGTERPTQVCKKFGLSRKSKPKWKQAKVFFKGTVFESLFGTSKDEAALKEAEDNDIEIQDLSSSPPQWFTYEELERSEDFEVTAQRIRSNGDCYYAVGKNYPLAWEMKILNHEDMSVDEDNPNGFITARNLRSSRSSSSIRSPSPGGSFNMDKSNHPSTSSSDGGSENIPPQLVSPSVKIIDISRD